MLVWLHTHKKTTFQIWDNDTHTSKKKQKKSFPRLGQWLVWLYTKEIKKQKHETFLDVQYRERRQGNAVNSTVTPPLPQQHHTGHMSEPMPHQSLKANGQRPAVLSNSRDIRDDLYLREMIYRFDYTEQGNRCV
uniref:Uncharacterized protein n=1 Tax=Octopus bimaculoides TaxID=37653 RepID=A0A0L8GQM1_OCTBM